MVSTFTKSLWVYVSIWLLCWNAAVLVRASFFSSNSNPDGPGSPYVPVADTPQRENTRKSAQQYPKRYEYMYSVKYPFKISVKGSTTSVLPGYTLADSAFVTKDNKQLFLVRSEESKGAVQSQLPFKGKELEMELSFKCQKLFPLKTLSSSPGAGIAFWWSTNLINVSTSASKSNLIGIDTTTFEGIVIQYQPSPKFKADKDAFPAKIIIQATKSVLPKSYDKAEGNLVKLGECMIQTSMSKLRFRYTSIGVEVEFDSNKKTQTCMIEPVALVAQPRYFTLSAQNNGPDQAYIVELLEMGVSRINPNEKPIIERPPIPKPTPMKNSKPQEEPEKKTETVKEVGLDGIQMELKSLQRKVDVLGTQDARIQMLQKSLSDLQRSLDMFVAEYAEQRATLDSKLSELLQIISQKVGYQISSSLKKHTEQTVEWLQEKTSVTFTALIWFALIQSVIILVYNLVKRKLKTDTKKYL